jgi:hypothetical protein
MMMNHEEYEEGGDNVDDPNTLFDQAKIDLDAAKADLDAHQTELEMAQERYNDANSRYKDAMQRFLEADLTRNCRWNQMVSYKTYIINIFDILDTLPLIYLLLL